MAAFLAGCFAFMWVEYQFEHVWEDAENGGFLSCWVVAGLGVMPINYSFRREQGSSTKGFLSSLPVKTSELFLANWITAIIFLVLLAMILIFEFWIFGIPFGMKYVIVAVPLGILCSAIYIVLYYVFNFNIAQLFYLGSMMIAVIFFTWLDVDFEAMALFANPHVTVMACIAMVVVAICIIALLCKLKRRIL